MDKVGIRTIVVNFDDEQLPYLSLVQGDAKTRGFDIVICDSDGKEIPPSDDYIVELVATGSSAPDTPYANRHMIKDGKYRVMIPTEALSESGFVFLQLVFYQKSTGAVIHTIEQKCPVYRSRGQEVVESNNLYVDITALRLGLEKIEKLDSKYEEIIEKDVEIQNNETMRKEAENKRNLEEVIRQDNEVIRKSNEEKREQLKTALIELKNSIESDLESINLTVDDIISSEDDRKQNEIVREEIKVELENLVADIQNKLDNGDFVGEKGEQGIQGEQGPQGPPGEVAQEEFDNFKDANSLKIAKLEKELQNYKSTMANINVNQEVKQSVSGYGSVSPPKNTANGQVSSTQKGLTAINLLGTNGDFASGTDKLAKGWKMSEPLLRHEYDGIEKSQSFSMRYNDNYLYYNLNINDGHKYYIRFLLKKTIEEESKLSIGFENTIGETTKNFTTITNDIYNTETYTEINKMLLPTADYSFIGFSGLGGIRCNAKIKDMTLVNLTELFGAGNEPTIDECKQIFNGHISGTKSTISASRLKSVDKDGTQESTLYLPNVGELRSLPNGVRDEVRVNGSKAELVKRVSDEFAVPMSGWSFRGITEQGFILLINFITLPNFATQRYGEFRPNDSMVVNNSNLPAYTTTANMGMERLANVECIATGYLNGLNLYVTIHPDNYNKTQDSVGANAWVNENMQGITLNYQLAKPIVTPIEVSGTLLSYPSGTVYVEKVLPVAGIYTDEITIAHTDFPISSLDKISKIDFATGVETQLDVSKAVVATDKLSFTHTDLTSGDIVFFEYFYANESTQGKLELEYYDSRHVLKDSVTGKFYKIIPTVANGVLTNELLEV